jgi:ribosomal protein S18 acetylase RimI-like enzyme
MPDKPISKANMRSETMENFTIRSFRPGDAAEVIDLWRECGLIVPWNNPQTDIDRKYADSAQMFFVGELEHEIIASCMAGYDGHRGWIYFLAVKNSKQRKGCASALVAHVEEELVKLGCPKVELMVRKTNNDVISFYKSIGFDPDPVIVLSKRLIEDEKHNFG